MFNIIIKEMKEFFRDKTNLFFFIMFPTVLVFLLGSLLESMDKSEETIGQIKIQYLIETENPYQMMAIANFVEAAGENGCILFEKVEDLTNAKKLAGEDTIAAAVLFTGDPLTIQVFEGSSQIKNRTVSSILNSFLQTNKAISAVMAITPKALEDLDTNEAQTDYIQQKDLGVSRSMIDYYAVSMVAMIGFMSMMLGAGAFVGERQNKTINRLIIAPQNRVFLFLQKIFGMVPQVVIQIAIIMSISTLLFKAHYGVTLKDNLYLFFLFIVMTLCMISIGAVAGLVIKANPMLIIMPVLWLMMFFGGTYSTAINIKGFTDAMPIYQIQQAAFDLAIFGRYDKANTVIIICSIIMIGALAMGAFLFSRKEEER